jgi:hypothetical protein
MPSRGKPISAWNFAFRTLTLLEARDKRKKKGRLGEKPTLKYEGWATPKTFPEACHTRPDEPERRTGGKFVVSRGGEGYGGDGKRRGVAGMRCLAPQR